MKSFLSNLNPRLLIIHFIAFWFFAYAFLTLAVFYDFSFLNVASEYMLWLNDKTRFLKDKEFIRQMGNFGLLVAYIISWSISTKRKWHWVNSVIVFVLTFALYNLGWFGWNALHGIFQAPAKMFPPNNKWGYITNGFIMLAIGSLLFFLKAIKKFISHETAKGK